MPLDPSKVVLEMALVDAYTRQMDAGGEAGASPDDVIINLANDLSFAIDRYYLTALVSTDDKAFTGQLDSAAGATTAEGTGTGTGVITPLDKVENEDDDKGTREGTIVRYAGAGEFEVEFEGSDELSILPSGELSAVEEGAVAFLALPEGLEKAYKKSKDSGAAANPPDQTIRVLAEDLGTIIHIYMISGAVTTIVTIQPGQASSGPSGAGSYNAPGIGAGVGIIKYEAPTITALKKDIEIALLQSLSEGSATGADPNQVVRNLSRGITAAVHKFVLTAIVETQVAIAGEVPIVGYMTPSTPPVALPAKSELGLGEGVGNLS